MLWSNILILHVSRGPTVYLANNMVGENYYAQWN
jgi:hypothetical protein